MPASEEWRNRSCLSKLTPPGQHSEGLINIDQDLTVKVERDSQPGMVLSKQVCTFSLNFSSSLGSWNSNGRTEGECPLMNPLLNSWSPMCVHGAKKFITISYSFPGCCLLWFLMTNLEQGVSLEDLIKIFNSMVEYSVSYLISSTLISSRNEPRKRWLKPLPRKSWDPADTVCTLSPS